MPNITGKLKKLQELQNCIFFDKFSKLIYATDASVYKETPLAVVVPKHKNQILTVINFCKKNNLNLIPRAAGTSLAGQVVGSGIVVDISKNFKKIIELNLNQQSVEIEPGVNLDELNYYLKKHNLHFGPETSTSNRCLLGGMLGNNSCGSHSLIYGSVRDHILELTAYLSDGSEVVFKELSKQEFSEKLKLDNLEGKLYQNIYSILSDKKNAKRISKEYPLKTIKRRNNGYAIDVLLESEIFTPGGPRFNMAKMVAGSEGTLCFVTKLKLNCVPYPNKVKAVVCVHVNSNEAAFKANLIALKQQPVAVEMIDKFILNCTKTNISQIKNRFFLQGEPEALLVVEFFEDSKDEIIQKAKAMEMQMREAGYAYAFPILYGKDIAKVWALRKAGLGLLSNVPGDKKPVAVIEDTVVDVKLLPDFMNEFQQKLDSHNLNCVYYAHIGSGELHLRPLLNLKLEEDIRIFRIILKDIAELVKKYRGSLCGEHGVGRLRGEFLPYMIGKENYKLLEEIKKTWDPQNIFNPNKIVNTPKMIDKLRFRNYKLDNFETIYDFSSSDGFIRGIEKCNGSGDCRKSAQIGGSMCPTFQASGEEVMSTRARANLLREFFYSEEVFKDKKLYQLINYCMSCKACKSECPSNVDMAKLKSEFLQHYYDKNSIPLRTQLIANIHKLNKIFSLAPSLFNWAMQTRWMAKPFMNLIGFSPKRSLPKLANKSLRNYLDKNLLELNPAVYKKEIVLFIDEFTNFNDTEIGITAVKLLTALGYKLKIVNHKESGRTYITKGLLRKAKTIANKNVEIISNEIENHELVGLEPSTILCFRDEYLELTDKNLLNKAKSIAKKTYTIDEFLAKEIEEGRIQTKVFSTKKLNIKLHCHCQQKAIGNSESLKKVLSFPQNFKVEEIDSGCCGMSGSFGYEKEHYDLSMKIGELKLFPAIRDSEIGTEFIASGTSCRHQIKDGTGVHAKHPVQILYEALK